MFNFVAMEALIKFKQTQVIVLNKENVALDSTDELEAHSKNMKIFAHSLKNNVGSLLINAKFLNGVKYGCFLTRQVYITSRLNSYI